MTIDPEFDMRRSALLVSLAIIASPAASQVILESAAPVQTLDPRLETGRACDPSAGEAVLDYVNGFLTTWKVCGRDGVPQRAEVLRFGYARDVVQRGWSGFVADGATLQLAQGPVAPGAELMRVQVRHGAAGTLMSEIDVRTGLGGRKKVIVLRPGTPVYGLVREAPVDPQFGAMAPKYHRCAVPEPLSAFCFPDHGNRRDTFRLGFGVNRTSPGDSPYAPARVSGDWQLFAKSPPAQVQPAREPFSRPLTLRVRLTRVEPERLLLVAELDDGTVARPLRTTALRRNADGSAALSAFGGAVALTPAAAGVSVRTLQAPAPDAVIRFQTRSRL